RRARSVEATRTQALEQRREDLREQAGASTGARRQERALRAARWLEGGVGVPGASVDELAAELARADGALRNQSRATALYGASRPEQHAGVAATKRQGVRQG